MIRGFELTINPNLTYAETASFGSKNQGSELELSFHDLDKNRSLFKRVSKGCEPVGRISHLSPLKLIAEPIGAVAHQLGQVSKVANFYTKAESFSSFVENRKLGLNLETAKEVLSIADMGLELIAWFSIVEKLGVTVKVTSRLTSMNLGIELLYPTIDLIRHLRSEGLEALQGPTFYKTFYKLGLALLAVYLFMTASILSTYLSAAITSINFAMDCPDYFDQSYELYSSLFLNNELYF